MNDITQLLEKIDLGDEKAASELFSMVYDELLRLARWHMAGERVNHTLQSTALVHEAFVRMIGVNQVNTYRNRSSFFSAASEAMRHILVDAARRKQTLKRGGGKAVREELDIDKLVVDKPDELIAVHESIDSLAEVDPQCAELVKLHYFSGFSLEEIAEIMGISRSTANRWWIYARSWLRTRIQNDSCD